MAPVIAARVSLSPPMEMTLRMASSKDSLLEDNRFFDAARHANELAFRLRDGITALGYPFPVASPTNQQFPVLPNTVMAQLQDMGYEFEIDGVVDADHTRIRLVTSWATPESAVENFLRDLEKCR